MPFTHSKGARIHWEEEGVGTPVLLVMGHRSSSELWYPVIPALAARHRVIRFDNRGTGQSDTTRGFTIADLADDAAAVLDAAGVERAHVYGVSMGGVVAQEIGLRHPERVSSLVLGCTTMGTADVPRMSPKLHFLYWVPKPLMAWLIGRRGHGYGSAAPAELVAKDQQAIARDVCTPRGGAEQQMAIWKYRVTEEEVHQRLTMPALVLHGDEDTVVPFAWGERLAKALPHSEFVAFHGAGHNYLISSGAAANQAVLGFIDRVEAA